jgi:hypothetical protein
MNRYTRRTMIASALGGLGALNLLDRPANAEPLQAPVPVPQVKAARQDVFKIRITNNFNERIIFGIFGLGHEMQFRAMVEPNQPQFEPNEWLRGGHRMVIIWDEFKEYILAYRLVLLNENTRFVFQSNGVIEVS